MVKFGIRAKGANGELELAKILNPVVHKVKRSKGIPEENILNKHNQIQRNTRQTANGGSDLINTYGLAIEVKRQQTLNINKWWEQCCKSAFETSEIPVLIFRQNNKAWRVIMYARIEPSELCFRSEISITDFLLWYEDYLTKNMI